MTGWKADWQLSCKSLQKRTFGYSSPRPPLAQTGPRAARQRGIGGLRQARGAPSRTKPAAAKFRRMNDRAQIGGARAVDYSAVKVDTSGPSMSVAGEIGARGRSEYIDAVRFLGMIKSSLVEGVIVRDVSISKIAGKGCPCPGAGYPRLSRCPR